MVCRSPLAICTLVMLVACAAQPRRADFISNPVGSLPAIARSTADVLSITLPARARVNSIAATRARNGLL